MSKDYEVNLKAEAELLSTQTKLKTLEGATELEITQAKRLLNKLN